MPCLHCETPQSSAASSNTRRTYIKRRRFHMAQQGVKTKRSMRDDVALLLAESPPVDPMLRDPRELSRHDRERLESEPPELRRNLFKIYGQCNPHFPEETSKSKSARTSKSSGPSRLSDASIHKPSFDPYLRQRLDDAIEGLEAAGQLQLEDIPQVVSFFTSCETTASIFLKYDTEKRISKINQLLEKWNKGH